MGREEILILLGVLFITGLILEFLWRIWHSFHVVKAYCHKPDLKITNYRIRKLTKALKYYNVLMPNNEKKAARIKILKLLFIEGNEKESRRISILAERLERGRSLADFGLIFGESTLAFCTIVIGFIIGIALYLTYLESYIKTFTISSHLNQSEVVKINTDYALEFPRLIEINTLKNDTIKAKKEYPVSLNQEYIITTYIRVDLLYDNLTKETIEEDYKKYACAGLKINDDIITYENYLITKIDDEKTKTVSETDSSFYKVTYYYKNESATTLSVEYFLGNDAYQTTYCRGQALFNEVEFLEIDSGYETWQVLFAIIENTQIKYQDKDLNFTMNEADIAEFNAAAPAFKKTMATLTNNQMLMNIEIKNFTKPITKLEPSPTIDLSLNKEELYSIIKSEVDINKYDHIFFLVKLGDAKTYLKDLSWAGYGGSEYQRRGEGYSVVRLPDGEYLKAAWWTVTEGLSKYPELVYIHEFFHYLESASTHLNLPMPIIHNYKEYGYKYAHEDYTVNEYAFFKDIVENKIKDNDKLFGVNPVLWRLVPTKYKDILN